MSQSSDFTRSTRSSADPSSISSTADIPESDSGRDSVISIASIREKRKPRAKKRHRREHPCLKYSPYGLWRYAAERVYGRKYADILVNVMMSVVIVSFAGWLILYNFYPSKPTVCESTVCESTVCEWCEEFTRFKSKKLDATKFPDGSLDPYLLHIGSVSTWERLSCRDELWFGNLCNGRCLKDPALWCDLGAKLKIEAMAAKGTARRSALLADAKLAFDNAKQLMEFDESTTIVGPCKDIAFTQFKTAAPSVAFIKQQLKWVRKVGKYALPRSR